ncbi:transmembrane protease serine 3-like isoform X1 [Salmo trutta]|uniref:transmembrane protease serine 3-like isoform X1 n=1 Tax=Salmo trutta TaxID=8032 RepID=UPI001131FDD4|nr:transmembrane protease serine 3-like isoform X1 [Salmo trutta]
MAMPDSDKTAADGLAEEREVSGAEGMDPFRIEVESVSNEDLPTVEIPTTFNVSPLSNQTSGSFSQDLQDPHVPTAPLQEPPAPIPKSQGQLTPPSYLPSMRFIKVRPFMHDDGLVESKTLCSQFLAHWLLLVIVACGLLVLSLALGIGLGVGVSCTGKFHCSTSTLCFARSAQCDGVSDCADGEDELQCVRLSGRSSVLQINSRGVWRTVCSTNWDHTLGYSACKQLGYSSYISSRSLPLSSVESAFQANLVSVNLSHPDRQQTVKIHNTTFLSKTQCSSESVIVLKCLDCGSRPMFRSRIAGGNVSQPGQFPWQASLHYQNRHLCGASIITPRWIVTAAHCVYGFATNTMLWAVQVGLTDQPANGVLSRSLEKIIYHASYQPKGLNYDIALLKLTEPLTFNGLVEPICLPNYGERFEEGKMCWISGWGATVDGGETSVSMHSAQVPVLSSRDCSGPGLYQGAISPWMVCAGYLEGGKNSCQGDSGGPLACEDSSVWKLAGATSWGYGCAERDNPALYTLISHALTWIHQQMEKEEALSS